MLAGRIYSPYDINIESLARIQQDELEVSPKLRPPESKKAINTYITKVLTSELLITAMRVSSLQFFALEFYQVF